MAVILVLLIVCRQSFRISSSLKHTNISSAEAHNMSAVFYFPPYLVYGENLVENSTYGMVADNITNGYGGVAFKVCCDMTAENIINGF